MLEESFNRIYNSGESVDTYSRIARCMIKHINWEVSLLKNNEFNKDFKHDSPLLGSLIALLALEKEFTRMDLPYEQVQSWKTEYQQWFQKRKFRSEKALKYKAAILEVFEDLERYGKKVPKDLWTTEISCIYYHG